MFNGTHSLFASVRQWIENSGRYFWHNQIYGVRIKVVVFFLPGVPKNTQKPKKDHRNKNNHPDDKSNTFHIPRNLDIQLETAKISPFDVVHLRYYTEYQWLVDFSLYAGIVYILSEIYHFYFPIKEEINLSMMWCFLVIFFSL